MLHQLMHDCTQVHPSPFPQPHHDHIDPPLPPDLRLGQEERRVPVCALQLFQLRRSSRLGRGDQARPDWCSRRNTEETAQVEEKKL